ncbi:MAG: efflux RND transporter periplasmic adaptor subunit [Undibacterium sp.]|uniref:efflux RND transporter periplasmic adaptor subunit n=1 Tax=Undibacterium sp. TaxID=1914977 RepID=UPI00271B37DD|nr:efflux RND transporter periplasmic adaptor subunit [Undibacterium sp.]MDO8652845.1 efflux RND transporter periplasmic adaptor subunit [Undibacterium sp.]
MFKRRGIWIVALILAIGTGIVVMKKKTAGNGTQSASKQPATMVAQVLEFLPTDVVIVANSDVRKLLSLSGALRPYSQAVVKAKVAGDVLEVLVREGEAVQPGQILVKMDTADYDSRLEQARGSLAAVQGQLEIARQTRDNNKALLDKAFISKNAYDNASNQYAIAFANVATAKGAVAVTQKALADTVIRAPIAGLISSRSVQPGEKVSPDNRLFEVVDLRVLEMEAPVPTQDIGSIKIGQQVQLKIEGVSTPVSGKVIRINPATTVGSRSIMAYIQIVNQDGVLRAGMFGEAELVVEQKTGVLSVPQTAVRNEDGKTFVYTIENSVLQQKQVSLGLQGDSNGIASVELVSGLSKDAVVIKNNLGNLRAGIPVKMIQPAGKV